MKARFPQEQALADIEQQLNDTPPPPPPSSSQEQTRVRPAPSGSARGGAWLWMLSSRHGPANPRRIAANVAPLLAPSWRCAITLRAIANTAPRG